MAKIFTMAGGAGIGLFNSDFNDSLCNLRREGVLGLEEESDAATRLEGIGG